ncbi:MAG: hypothetical protein IT165_06640 [Bryobacterales bacterium]|nr:hypothetical protein [Bryobacterales bacterium]
MSQRQYAEHRNCARSAIQRAIAESRISTLPDGRIDPDVADEEWARNTRQIHVRGVNRHRQGDVGDDDGFDFSQYTKARAVREHYLARISKIEYEKLVGSVISTDEARIAQFQIDRLRRDSMLNIADRVCAAIAAEVREIMIAAGVPVEQANAIDMTRVHTIMVGEIRKGLNDYADGLTGPAA